jgi:hypothetical protein
MPDFDIDWVKARSECCPARVFQQLKLGVEADVKARQAIHTPDENYGFSTASAAGSVTVLIQGNHLRGCVTFDQTEDGISVRNEKDEVMLEATLTLNNEGQCRLKVLGQEYELWQFRKIALEHLLFDSPWRSAEGTALHRNKRS